MVQLTHIQQAFQRILRDLPATPVVRAPHLESNDAKVQLKLESMHRTGSFKERGALNKLLQLKEKKGKGIVAASAGNHAQAVAYHGARLGMEVTIVMPEITPLNKIAATQRWGAKVRLEGKNFDEAMELAREIEKKQKLSFVHAYDDPEIIAGQGTMGLELLQQIEKIDTIVVPVGGGGLCSGTAIALKESRPGIRVIGVQSESYPHVYRAWSKSQVVELKGDPPATIADGIAIKGIGEITVPLLEKYLDDMVTVSEGAMANAVLSLMESSKLVAEGAGAATVAAWLSGKLKDVKGNVVLVLSGGNIDVNLVSRIIEKGLARSGRLVRLEVVIPDRPGGLRALTSILADVRANILHIHHERSSEEVQLYSTGTHLTLETRGPDHKDEIISVLRKNGYSVQIKS